MVNWSIQCPFEDMQSFGLLRESAEESRDYHSLNFLSDSFLRARQLARQSREHLNGAKLSERFTKKTIAFFQ
jgi:hypothetical protein